jgi:IS30 family transposase
VAAGAGPLEGRATWGHVVVATRASTAQHRARDRTARPKPVKLATNTVLRECVTRRLERGWSPRQIAATLNDMLPDRPEMRVSHETIYQTLYVRSRSGLR